MGRDEQTQPQSADVRWRMKGKHSGWGGFGKPTGAEVHIMGVSHAEFGAISGTQAKLRREFVIFDETAIWKQILLHTGAL